MYPGEYAEQHPDQPALIMAGSGETLTFAEFEANANRLAHLYRDAGLRRGDHVAFFVENHLRYFETMAAAERAGLYYTCINSYLTPEEVAYIVDDCDARLFITSVAKSEVAVAADGADAEGGVVPLHRRHHRHRTVPSRTTTRSPRSPPSGSRTSSSGRRCSTRRGRRGGRRASSARCPRSIPASRCR